MTYPNGEVVNTSYNDAMEPRTLTGSSSYVDNATYNALGLPKMLDLGNNLFQHFTYWGNGLDFTFSGVNTWGRLRAVCVTALTTCADAENNSNVRMHLAYAYDNAGNITNLGDWTTGMHPAYSYDAQDRLVSWSIGGTTQETYSYDALGRMTQRSTLGTFSYGHASKVHAVTGVGAGTFSYDANGNMLSRWQSGTTFTQEWNADNKASRVHGGGHDIRYFYDADGVLVRRTSGGVTTVFVGNHAEWNSSTSWTNYYHFNGQRVAKRNSSGVFWLHGDHPSTSSGQALGSTSLATNSSGGTHSQVRYGPFGSERWTNGAMPTSYKFIPRFATLTRDVPPTSEPKIQWGYTTTMRGCIRRCWRASSRRTALCRTKRTSLISIGMPMFGTIPCGIPIPPAMNPRRTIAVTPA